MTYRARPRPLLADFVVKVFWGPSTEWRAKIDSCQTSTTNHDSMKSVRSGTRFYQSYFTSDYGSPFTTWDNSGVEPPIGLGISSPTATRLPASQRGRG